MICVWHVQSLHQLCWTIRTVVNYVPSTVAVVEVRSATQMVSLMHIQESQPFGDSVTETIGGTICDSDIEEAL